MSRHGHPSPRVFWKSMKTRDFKSNDFVRVRNKGLTGENRVRVSSKGLTGFLAWSTMSNAAAGSCEPPLGCSRDSEKECTPVNLERGWKELIPRGLREYLLAEFCEDSVSGRKQRERRAAGLAARYTKKDSTELTECQMTSCQYSGSTPWEEIPK
jgi:hypothetical protein